MFGKGNDQVGGFEQSTLHRHCDPALDAGAAIQPHIIHQ